MAQGARPPRRAALRISLAYLLFGAAWILSSDWVLERTVPANLIHRYHLQTAKGWVFIAVTAAMLYFLIRRTYTAVRASAQAQRQTEQRTRLLVERVRDYAIFTLDAAGNVTSWNRGAEEITQWSEHDVLGQPLDVFYPADETALDRPKRDLAQ